MSASRCAHRAAALRGLSVKQFEIDLPLRKIDADYDPHDRVGAMSFLQRHAAKGQIVTGLLYVDHEAEDLHAHLDTVDVPLNTLDARALCPGSAALDKINAALR